MGVEVPSNPINRKEQYLAKIAGQAVEIPAEPLTREEAYLDKIAKNGSGGGGGTTNYNLLSNKPQIDGVELKGNKSLSDLGIASAQSVSNITNGESINNFADVETALGNKQGKLTAGDYIDITNGEISVDREIPSVIAEYEIKTEPMVEGQAFISVTKTVNGEVVLTQKYGSSTSGISQGINFDENIYVDYSKTAAWSWTYKLRNASVDHAADYTQSWNYGSTVDYTEEFFVEDHRGDKLVIKSEMDMALAGKQNTLTFDDTPTDGSNNPVKSNGIYDSLAGKQSATDNNLDTDAKTIVGAINEHEGDIDSLKSGFTTLNTDVEELQAYTGYSTTDIIGIEVDYVNKSFRRLGAAVGKNGGSDFDNFPMFGGRRRCNVADDGTISKYYGDTGYAEDGSNGQVMVYQPKFYYKVVPLKLEKQSTGKGYHIRKAAYYVTATPMKGFKVHPAFVNASGNEVDYILVGASKGCIYDVSESAYILDDAQVMDNTADKFSSIFGVKPASGLTQDLTRPKIEQMCQNRGANWHELNVQMASMTQLLMLIEYGKFDMQRAIGKGVVDITDNSSYNCGATSGSTSALGNASGRATSTTIVTNTSTTYTDNGKTSVTYRGEEDPYGDMWEFVMGMNIYGNGSMNGGEPYICSDYNYAESKNTDNYKGAGFTIANSDGYVNAWGYGSEDFDWLFIASEVGGSDALPVGDYLWKTANLNGYRIALVGAGWAGSWRAGGFLWSLGASVGNRHRTLAGRLAYIPA